MLLPASVHDRMRTAHRTQHGQAAQPISFPSKAGAPISQLPRIRSRSPADSVTRKQASLLASGRAQPGCARRAPLLPGGQSCCSWLQTWRVNGEVGWDEAQGRKADGGGVKVGLLCSAGSRGNWFPTVLSRGFPAGCDLRTFRSFSEAQRPQTKLLTELLTARVVKCTNSLVFRINGRAHPVSKAILPHASAFSLLQQPTGVAEQTDHLLPPSWSLITQATRPIPPPHTLPLPPLLHTSPVLHEPRPPPRSPAEQHHSQTAKESLPSFPRPF